MSDWIVIGACLIFLLYFVLLNVRMSDFFAHRLGARLWILRWNCPEMQKDFLGHPLNWLECASCRENIGPFLRGPHGRLLKFLAGYVPDEVIWGPSPFVA